MPEPLSLANTLWQNTVITSGKVIGLVLYTGKDTRMEKNSKQPRSKFGIFDQEINYINKLLFVLMLTLSAILICFKGFDYLWFILYFRYMLLLSSIIPISLRVNLDFSKTVFSYRISHDDKIPGTIARNSSIPEELGRIDYLLSDKTGTLTRNEMKMKKISLQRI